MIDIYGRFFYFDKMDDDGLNGVILFWKNSILYAHRAWRVNEAARIFYDGM